LYKSDNKDPIIVFPMKLLLASSSFCGGGIASYAQELIKSYTNNFEMSVIIGNDSLHPLDQYNAKIYYYEMDDTSEKNAREVLSLINEKIKPDVIMNSCARLMSLLVPFLDNSIKVINVSHSLRYNEADFAGFNSEYADVVIALSNYNKQYLEKNFNCRSKVEVVYNFVRDLDNQSEILDKKINSDIPVIVFSGGGTACKSPEIIYAIAMKLLKTNLKFKFYWLGMTTPPFKKILPFKEIRDILPKDPRLIITGRIPRAEAIRISNEANIFLIPSRREGCPMALLEAMRIGTIPITSDYDNGCKEIVRDGYNGYVISHNDINAFVSRIIDIITNPMYYNTIYLNCFQTFKDSLSFEVWKEKMDSIVFGNCFYHKKRNELFNLKEYLNYRNKQEKQSKRNLRHLLLT
jgi:glycosyltransferase involved in cell wall biosynthesis